MNISKPYKEFLIRLIATFNDKNSAELARIAKVSAPELCGGRSVNSMRLLIGELRKNAERVNKKDVEVAQKLLNGLPEVETISEYDLATMRIQNKPTRNK